MIVLTNSSSLIELILKKLDFNFCQRNLLITYHPVTLENHTSGSQIDELLDALSELTNIGLIFTMPNADSDSRVIFQKINDFCAQNSSAKAFVSLGQLLYFSCFRLLMELLVILLAAFLKYLALKKAQ